MNSEHLSPGLAAGIVFVVQTVGLAVMGLAGVLATLPAPAQFLLGLETIVLPIIVFVLIKRRRDRGE